jgi:hypothetical protein
MAQVIKDQISSSLESYIAFVPLFRIPLIGDPITSLQLLHQSTMIHQTPRAGVLQG